MFEDQQVAYLVGQALGLHQKPPTLWQLQHQQPQQSPQQLADRAVGYAFQFYRRSGLTKEQAVQRISGLAQMFGSLE